MPSVLQLTKTISCPELSFRLQSTLLVARACGLIGQNNHSGQSSLISCCWIGFEKMSQPSSGPWCVVWNTSCKFHWGYKSSLEVSVWKVGVMHLRDKEGVIRLRDKEGVGVLEMRREWCVLETGREQWSLEPLYTHLAGSCNSIPLYCGIATIQIPIPYRRTLKVAHCSIREVQYLLYMYKRYDWNKLTQLWLILQQKVTRSHIHTKVPKNKIKKIKLL